MKILVLGTLAAVAALAMMAARPRIPFKSADAVGAAPVEEPAPALLETPPVSEPPTGESTWVWPGPQVRREDPRMPNRADRILQDEAVFQLAVTSLDLTPDQQAYLRLLQDDWTRQIEYLKSREIPEPFLVSYLEDLRLQYETRFLWSLDPLQVARFERLRWGGRLQIDVFPEAGRTRC